MSTTMTNVMAVGDRAEPREFGPITRTDFVKYQGASGDFHPLHHDDPFAQSCGFPSVFSVGMLQAGLLCTYATDWLGPHNLRRYTLRFVEQCWPGDVLTCTGAVTDITVDEEGQRVTVELTCTRQTGGVAIAASAEFAVPRVPVRI